MTVTEKCSIKVAYALDIGLGPYIGRVVQSTLFDAFGQQLLLAKEGDALFTLNDVMPEFV